MAAFLLWYFPSEWDGWLIVSAVGVLVALTGGVAGVAVTRGRREAQQDAASAALGLAVLLATLALAAVAWFFTVYLDGNDS